MDPNEIDLENIIQETESLMEELHSKQVRNFLKALIPNRGEI